jgi:tRNA(fMet)-specific endonuclease VapC
MQYLLDSNLLIRVMVGRDRAVRRRLQIHRSELLLSSVVLHELYYGAYKSSRQQENLDNLLLLRIPVIPFDAEDARAAASIRADLEHKGTPIGPYDTLIAGQALARGLTVVTGNRREFERVEGLAVDDWA